MTSLVAHFRLFVGDLDPALSDDLFVSAFSGVRYPSFVKARIVRDKNTNKGKGYGFVSYKDPEDFLKAWKEMNGACFALSLLSWWPERLRREPRSTGKYVGTRPVKISKATAGVASVNIGDKKARDFDAKVQRKTGTYVALPHSLPPLCSRFPVYRTDEHLRSVTQGRLFARQARRGGGRRTQPRRRRIRARAQSQELHPKVIMRGVL